MDANTQFGELFHVEVARGVYMISSDISGPTADTRSMAPGNPTGNSYLVIGEQRAMLFDLAVNHPGLHEYAGRLADKPLQLVLSHGHYDHIFFLSQFSDAWLHPADLSFIREGMLGLPPVEPCPDLHPLMSGDIVDLGDRVLDVIHIPGHTPGSILLLDRQTRILLSGDTGARHLLLGLTEFVPLHEFCSSLQHLLQRDFDVMYAAHDRCAIPKAHIDRMIKLISEDLQHTDQRWTYPGIEEMAILTQGDLHTLQYFDVSVPVRYLSN